MYLFKLIWLLVCGFIFLPTSSVAQKDPEDSQSNLFSTDANQCAFNLGLVEVDSDQCSAFGSAIQTPLGRNHFNPAQDIEMSEDPNFDPFVRSVFESYAIACLQDDSGIVMINSLKEREGTMIVDQVEWTEEGEKQTTERL